MEGLAIYKKIYALLGSIVIPQTLHSISFKRMKKHTVEVISMTLSVTEIVASIRLPKIRKLND